MALWVGVSQAVFDPAKFAGVENITLVRDRIHIVLSRGSIEFTKLAAGKVFGAAFQGKGIIQVVPPSPLETQQLLLFTGHSALNMNFSEATFCFTDSTFSEISREVHWTVPLSDDLAQRYQRRQQARENEGADMRARLYQALLSAYPRHDAYFLADL